VEESARSAAVTWETNLRTDTVLVLVRGGGSEERKTNPDQPAETLHSLTLDGLEPRTTYTYRIVATDPRGRGQARTSDRQEFTTTTESPPPGVGGDGALINLLRSYIDKLSRMTPDEREKLKGSILKVTGNRARIDPATRGTLVGRPTDPQEESSFHDRLCAAAAWVTIVGLRGQPVDGWQKDLERLHKGYYVNRVRAAGRLDALIAEVARADDQPPSPSPSPR
jgi:hypothetical protein